MITEAQFLELLERGHRFCLKELNEIVEAPSFNEWSEPTKDMILLWMAEITFPLVSHVF